jgi:hypothetical protein
VWTAVRIIFGVHIDISNAALRAGIIGCCVPDIIQESYRKNFSSFMQRQLAAEPLGSSRLELSPPY